MVSHSGLITVMQRAARKAAPRLRRDFGEVEQLQVSRKGPGDFVSMADKRAEQTIVDELRNASPDFARLWERHDVQAPPMLRKTFRHPAVGEITLDCDTLTLTDRDQHLVLYSAPRGSRDAETLALLDVLGPERINASKPL